MKLYELTKPLSDFDDAVLLSMFEDGTLREVDKPLYRYDDEAESPQSYIKFRNLIAGGVLVRVNGEDK